MTLKKFNNNYIYQRDMDKFNKKEVWEVIIPDNKGKYYGDCESYCLTLIDKVDGFKDIKLYYCRLNNQGHCVGNVDGKWIDCNLKALVESLPISYTNIRKYWWIEIQWKKLATKLFGYVPFIKNT